jgi:antitoxin FitA
VSISLQLDDEQSRRLEHVAKELNVDPKELARAAINDLVSRPADDFENAVGYVLEKNRELYRRLA